MEKLAVIGSGLMGHGIALVAATSGQEVSLIDISDAILQKAVQKMTESVKKLAEKGKIKESPESVLKRIQTTTSIPDGVKDANYVIEAVLEDIDLKRKIFADLDKYAPKDAILATNTSGLSVTVIAEATQKREKVIGMHWMNPPQLMKLVEIIKSKYTDEQTLQSTLNLCRKYGKEIVIAQRDVWYFLAARARAGWSVESYLMYMKKEAGFMEMDAFARYKIGLPMGEFELADFTGAVDIRSRGLASVEKILKINPEFEPWPAFLSAYRHLTQELWEPLNKQGLSGLKTGKGFYSYPGGKYVKPEIPQELAAKIDPIQIMASTINAAAWCVTNHVGTVEDVNKSFKLAFGWPRGVFEFVDDYGIPEIIDVLKAKEKKAPDWLRDFYKVDPLLSQWEK